MIIYRPLVHRTIWMCTKSCILVISHSSVGRAVKHSQEEQKLKITRGHTPAKGLFISVPSYSYSSILCNRRFVCSFADRINVIFVRPVLRNVRIWCRTSEPHISTTSDTNVIPVIDRSSVVVSWNITFVPAIPANDHIAVTYAVRHLSIPSITRNTCAYIRAWSRSHARYAERRSTVATTEMHIDLCTVTRNHMNVWCAVWDLCENHCCMHICKHRIMSTIQLSSISHGSAIRSVTKRTVWFTWIWIRLKWWKMKMVSMYVHYFFFLIAVDDVNFLCICISEFSL